MFWADKVASEIIESGKYKPYWVDDMKTPSGRIHVGALRGVVVHDLVFKALLDQKVKAKFTWIFDDHDPMDALPVYLPKEKFEKYLGMPLYKVPSPVEGFENYAKYYALEFQKVFNRIGSFPEVLWSTEIYESGKMNDVVKEALDNAKIIKGIYEKMYKKDMPDNWYPFQVNCPNCGKVSTTRVYDWDGKEVSFVCETDKLKWTKGCGYEGKVSPFSSKKGIAGKLPWKVEWSAKWKALGITIEGAGKDHMSAGGSHDLTSIICEKVFKYPVPFAVPYEWFLVGGRKMSTSKGVGVSAAEMIEIIPPELLRFLMVRTNKNQAINFDPSENTIPNLFDEYQKFSNSSNPDEKRIFELSQIGKSEKVPSVRFTTLAQWVQMPNMEDDIKKAGAEDWAKYARVWIEKFATEKDKFKVQKDIPKEVRNLSSDQKKVLLEISKNLDRKWEGEDFQTKIYDIGKSLNLNGTKTFEAIYFSLLGKNHGPKAAWLILSLDKEFVKRRFKEVQ